MGIVLDSVEQWSASRVAILPRIGGIYTVEDIHPWLGLDVPAQQGRT